MRLAFRIDMAGMAPCAAFCVALCAAGVLIALPAGVNAQESALVQAANPSDSADAGSVTLASTTPAAAASPDETAVESGQLVGEVLRIPADAASVNDISLDDQVLSRQRGGAVGMVMVATTPQLMRGDSSGHSVTLWDEIAPPTPLPIPVDAARAAQGNVASYQRK
ncbi:hypothetical protein [Paraburkholderia lacunae]|uniref:PRC-barrel domain-containing protein n=1 Tax=Paraburkholderia lacunae TaxID=2211104 RepID=A0A370N6H2_9BURK|nr:hypothetical protein [Paraburkholderia lacunae]RDK01207.1 hypothetical protein DLM46_17950 [Paraburkholderia lacunae]